VQNQSVSSASTLKLFEFDNR